MNVNFRNERALAQAEAFCNRKNFLAAEHFAADSVNAPEKKRHYAHENGKERRPDCKTNPVPVSEQKKRQTVL